MNIYEESIRTVNFELYCYGDECILQTDAEDIYQVLSAVANLTETLPHGYRYAWSVHPSTDLLWGL